MQEHECYTSNVSSPAVSRIRALSACHRLSHLNSLFCSVLRASSAPSSSPPPLTVSHRCSRVVQEAVESSRMLQLTPCSTSRWPLGTKSLAGTVLLPPTRALSPWLAIAARQGVGSVCSRAVHGLAAFDTDTCSGWERRRCEWLCAASSTRQERPCFARSTTHARSLRSPAAAARRPTRGCARARSGPSPPPRPQPCRRMRLSPPPLPPPPTPPPCGRRQPSASLRELKQKVQRKEEGSGRIRKAEHKGTRTHPRQSTKDGQAAEGRGHAHV